jgi:hypothetical protein
MCGSTNVKRSRFLRTAGIGAPGVAATELGFVAASEAQTAPTKNQPASSGAKIPMGRIQIHAPNRRRCRA